MDDIFDVCEVSRCRSIAEDRRGIVVEHTRDKERDDGGVL